MSIILRLLVLLIAADTYATVNPDALIKISDKVNPACVEFYHYKGDLYCSTKVLTSIKPADPNLKNLERQRIIFDERVWQAAWGQQSESITTIEYVPAGDNIENWNELVTSQFIPNLQKTVSLKQYVTSTIDNLKKTGLNPIITIHAQTPDYVIFEFRILSPSNMRQDELQKISLGRDGFYVLHYVTKQADMGNEKRRLWLKNINESTIQTPSS